VSDIAIPRAPGESGYLAASYHRLPVGARDPDSAFPLYFLQRMTMDGAIAAVKGEDPEDPLGVNFPINASLVEYLISDT